MDDKNKRRSIYIITPRNPKSIWIMDTMVNILGTKALMPNAAIPLLIALTPKGLDIEYTICDENVSKIDLNIKCDLVVITGYTIHAKRIHELSEIFRQKGAQIALGGTYATIYKDKLTGLADYLFIGEAEYIWPKFLCQWVKEEAISQYVQEDYIDMKDSPLPNWSLINLFDYINFPVQTSRGCPNQCDFCDVIKILGRKYRTKSIDQILIEIKNAHLLGARSIFFSDDNFLGNKSFTINLLTEIIKWNITQYSPLSFSTQITVDVADDDQLLKLFADARFSVLFLGVETVKKESLEEVKKFQNLKYDIYERIRKISSYGIIPFIGLIVGFDNDNESIFNELYMFIEKTYNPICCISLLNAPLNTHLYNRLKKDNRIMGSDFSGEWQFSTNIVPKQMNINSLLANYIELFQKIYEPVNFQNRFKEWLLNVKYINSLYTKKKLDIRQLFKGIKIFRYFIFQADHKVKKLFLNCLYLTWQINPKLMRRTFTILAHYPHFYNFVNELQCIRDSKF
ncbi:MAG: DUF4070 domain-containing protein [Desulfobacterales bacterium]|nr:DUF4070 domain-containing protein [Desulfobacterales bacterium]